jgi:hypothetical protein
MSNGPENYSELPRFFPTQRQRAKALGVRADTVRSWDIGKPTRLWGRNCHQVELLVEMCQFLEQYMEAKKAGLWMLAPQPFLYGATPAAMLLEQCEAGLVSLQEAVNETPPPAEAPIEELVG